MPVMTGLSGNEMYCLRQKGLQAGDLVIGNSVFSIGMIGGIGSGLRTLAGGEVTQITSVIHDGRQQSYARMVAEAQRHGGIGITGVTSELIQHSGNIEFLSIGSCVHQEARAEQIGFSSSADGQELYCQIDAGFRPIKFVFGNVAYSIGIGGGLMGSLRGLARGEVVEYSRVFNETRHRALERITSECRAAGGNAVVGIETAILPFQGMQEMVMLGTASYHPALPEQYRQNPVSSDLTNEEMWNLVHMGYAPIQLVLGVSIYSLGIVGGITAAFKSLARGEISELTTLIYEARENAIAKIAQDATACGADDVVGTKTYVYQLGGGIIEFLAIGTAVKRIPGLTTVSPELPSQSVINDKDTFINLAEAALGQIKRSPLPTDKKKKEGWALALDILLKLLGG
ncbi:MAG TPA: heavy metal-binding domain-containing protein [Chthonomonadaceae bacterium]|nr:heavy metal-binding domain-containing protein [Chthonomonadaceae bacterium]